MDRRQFLRSALAGAAGLALGPSVWRTALAAQTARPAESPWGPLGDPDENGVRLPPGFSSRIVARSEQVVAGTGYVWHHAPDGGAVFPAGDGGWVYVSNSEVPALSGGGASAIRFGPDGSITAAYRILGGTNINCAGGAVGGRWFSCEEHDLGLVWACDPYAPGPGTPLPALGTFAHEAVAAGADGRLYLTEDERDGLFYRFTPAAPGTFDEGVLEAASVGAGGRVVWLPVPRPNEPPTRTQVAGATPFRGGEGCSFDPRPGRAGAVYLTTKGDNRVWAYDPARQTIEVIYDGSAPLRGVDNVTVSPGGDVLVAEDGDDMQICVIAGNRVYPLLQVVGHDGSEITGPAFSPDGSRLYFSSQRGELPAFDASAARPGVTFEVTGPF